MRLPIRTRLTVISTAMTAVVLVAAGAFLYLRLRADLLQAVDDGLRSRASAILSVLEGSAGSLGSGAPLIEADEAFAQVIDADGTLIDSSPGLPEQPIAPVVGLTEPRFSDATVPTLEEAVPARLLAVPADGRVVVVGASLEDQHDALARLAVLMSVGGPVSLALVAGVAWLVTRAAFRPVERMRAEAAAISADDASRRLPLPETGDEIARLGETLNRMLDRLASALERERRFVSDASHELRTPLANLKSEIELALRRARTQDELVAALRSAGHETERLVRLAEDLLVLARTGSGGLEVRRPLVDVGALVDREVAAISTRAAGRDLTIERRLDGDLRADVDPTRIRQAVGNLLDNAVRHSPAGGTITVDVRARDGRVSLEVIDEGEGFPEAFVGQAFEPFARAESSRARVAGGTGLGLAIVRAVAEAHGGTARIRNLPGGGACVTLEIPA
jgi:two-component system OmpR family sensor kinase